MRGPRDPRNPRDMRGLLAWVRSHWRALRGPSRVDADMHDEMRLHIDMDAERRMRQGLDAGEARRQVVSAFERSITNSSGGSPPTPVSWA